MNSGCERQRAGDADALALAAGKLMGIAVEGVGRQLDGCASALSAPRPAFLAGADALDLKALGQDLADRHARRQAREGSWKIYCMRGPLSAHLGGREFGEFHTVEAHLARRRLDQAQHRAADRGLAAARFADEADHLALGDIEGDTFEDA